MNQILPSAGHSQRAKMSLIRAVFGGSVCVVCTTVTLADERGTLRLPPTSMDNPSASLNSPALWADLPSPDSHHELTLLDNAVKRPGFDTDPPWTAPSHVSASVHVGPAQSAFILESFRGARLLNAQPVSRVLRPSRLPPTGYFDESMTDQPMASGPHESRFGTRQP